VWKSRCVSTPLTSPRPRCCCAAFRRRSSSRQKAPFDVEVASTQGAAENGRRCCEGSRHRRRAPIRSRRCSGPRAACGRHRDVRPTSHSEGTFWAHVEGGSGRFKAPPTAILQDTHSVEEVFSELRLYGVLRSWPSGRSPKPKASGLTPRGRLAHHSNSCPTKRLRPTSTSPIVPSVSISGSGSRATPSTSAQGPQSTETNSPAQLSLARHPPSE
jgi:hypothetical protein